ncbi:MAG: hypothetical protein K8W52_36605 [Deltaproteobacteria bacterium]|nr:hypothetical protein [Deltaproteobacteria bacterium]
MRSGLLRVFPAMILIGLAAWEIARVRAAPGGVPGDEDWDTAAELVRTQFQPGDLIVFAPDWIDPVGRLHLGDLIPLDAAGRMDDARFGSVWELSIRGARAPEATGEMNIETDTGGVTVRHFVRPAAEVVTDLVAQVGKAQVTGERDRGPTADLFEVGFAPHRCVLVVPRPDRTVTITYRGIALGKELVGYVGLADVFKRRDVRDPGRMVVSVGEQEVATVTVDNDSGWTRFAAPTAPGTGDVTIALTAVGPTAKDRLLCFAAEARR